jgi:type II secretory pathway component PulK
MMSGRNMKTGSSGSVLILSLWVLLFLGALSLAIGASVSASIRVARHLSIRRTGLELARGGVQRAMLAVSSGNTNEISGAGSEHWSMENKELAGGAFSVFYTAGQGAQVVTNFGVVAESARTNINNMSQMQSLFANSLGEGEAKKLMSAVQEYRKSKKLLTRGGVNGRFESVYELLLVEGVDRQMFDEFEPYITVYGSSCFRGMAVGHVQAGDGSLLPLGGRIAFVFDSKANKIVYWRQ